MNKNVAIFLILGISFNSIAQIAPNFIPRYNYENHNAWESITGVAKLNNRFDLHTDLQIRQSNYGKAPLQYLIRPGIIYNFDDQFAISGGYLYAISYKYGEVPGTKFTFPEHRVWEQFIIKSKVNRVEIQQRVRMEHRWLGEVTADMEVAKYRYQNRLRYLLRANVSLNGEKIEKGVFYFCAYDELMINFGQKVGGNVYDQNRLFAGIGYHLGIAGKIEIGYLYQNLMQRRIWYPSAGATGFTVFENNHTLLISYSFKLDFAKKFE